MEADYSGTPLLIITADRPKSYRGSGAPQSCHQPGIFSHYLDFSQDLEAGDAPDLASWIQNRPAHLNACFDEPLLSKKPTPTPFTKKPIKPLVPPFDFDQTANALDRFLNATRYPLVIVNAIPHESQAAVCDFLLALNAPVILENISNLREEPKLQKLSITSRSSILEGAKQNSYPVDGVLRIGGVPTLRLWRDLEEMRGKIPVFNLTEERFSGLSWSHAHTAPIKDFLLFYHPDQKASDHSAWLEKDAAYQSRLEQIINEEPKSEPSLIHALSETLPQGAFVYLGNSMPIREWDLAATRKQKNLRFAASRGLNGIDGQIATFLGMCRRGDANWAILGDLTALYDLSAPWFLSQLEQTHVNIVIINNGGGKIFDRMFGDPLFQNSHTLQFEHFAKLWNLSYERWESIPSSLESSQSRIIELCPDPASTTRFWNQIQTIK